MPPVHDYVIDNSTGANVRSDINSVLQAILTNNSSSSAPSTTAAYMWWADTTTGILKIRNSANDGWVELLQLDGTLTLEDGSASTPGLAFRDDLNTGIFSSAADTFNVATGGVERMELGATTIFNEDGADVDFRIEGDTAVNLFYVDAGNNRIGVNTDSPLEKLHVKGSLYLTLNGSNANEGNAVKFQTKTGGFSTSYGAAIHGLRVGDTSSYLRFDTGGQSEKMRLDSSGRLLLGTTTEGNGDGDEFTIANVSGANMGMTIRSGTGALGNLFFSDATSGNAEFSGAVQYGHNNNSLRFLANESERARFNNAGKFFIGTDGSSAGGDASSPMRVKQLVAADGSYTDFTQGCYEAQVTINSGGNDKNIALFNGWDGGIHGVSMSMMYDGGYHIVFGTNNDTSDRPTQRMIIRKDGQVVVGPNDSVGGSAGGVRLQDPDSGTSRYGSANSGQITYIQFINGGSITGSISGNSSSTSYNTSSDYRLKENETAITDGITRLKQLKPYRFNWKSDSSTIVDGFFAHEVSSIVPESITGTKDAVAVEDDVKKGLADSIGDPIYQNIDQSKLVPLLVAAVKELIAKVETLEAA